MKIIIDYYKSYKKAVRDGNIEDAMFLGLFAMVLGFFVLLLAWMLLTEPAAVVCVFTGVAAVFGAPYLAYRVARRIYLTNNDNEN